MISFKSYIFQIYDNHPISYVMQKKHCKFDNPAKKEKEKAREREPTNNDIF